MSRGDSRRYWQVKRLEKKFLLNFFFAQQCGKIYCLITKHVVNTVRAGECWIHNHRSQFAHMNNIMLCYPEVEFPFDTAQVNLRFRSDIDFWKAIHYHTIICYIFWAINPLLPWQWSLFSLASHVILREISHCSAAMPPPPLVAKNFAFVIDWLPSWAIDSFPLFPHLQFNCNCSFCRQN